MSDLFFKTTAIDHSTIPPVFASVYHHACFGVARQSAGGGGRIKILARIGSLLAEPSQIHCPVSPEV
jgi:hypothetical protein